jgi:hypothetical protein
MLESHKLSENISMSTLQKADPNDRAVYARSLAGIAGLTPEGN